MQRGSLRDFLEVFFTACLLLGVQFGIQVVLAKALGADLRGSFAICWSFLNILIMFGVFGVSDANTYRLASSKATVSQVYGVSVWLAILAALIIGPSAYAVIHLPVAFFSKASKGDFIWTIIAVWPFVLSLYLLAILRGTSSYKAMNVMRLLGPVVALGAICILCLCLNFGVRGAVIAQICGSVFAIIFTSLKLRSKLLFKDIVGGFRQIPNTLHYAFRSFFGRFAITMNLQVSVLVIGCFLEPAEVGFYAIAVAMVFCVGVITNSLCLILLPKLAQRPDTSGTLACRALRTVVPLIALAGVGLALVCNPLIKYCFPEEFLPTLTAIYILVNCVIFQATSKIISTYLLATNRPGINSAIKLLCLFINITLLFFFVRAYGLIGGCVATVLYCIVEALMMVFAFVRISGIKSWRLMLLQKDDVAYIRESVYSLAFRSKR